MQKLATRAEIMKQGLTGRANTGHQKQQIHGTENKTLRPRNRATGTLPITKNLPGQMQTRKVFEPM